MKPSEERSASGSSRCQTSRSSEIVSCANESSSSWCSAPRRSATKRASASSLPSPASLKPTANVCTGRSICFAISATIRLESSPPLSIAPSGTSLIRRSRTDSSSSAEQPRAPLLDVAAALERRLADSSSTAAARRAPFSIDEDAARLELLHRRERRRGRREEPEREVGVDRLVVEVGRDEPAREQALELGGEDEQVAADRVVERLDPEPVARDRRRAAAPGPRPRSRTSRAAAPGTSARAPRRGAAGSRCRSGSRSGGRGGARSSRIEAWL